MSDRLTITQGVGYTLVLTYTDGAIPPAPIDVTGWSAACELRTVDADGNPDRQVARVDSTDGIEVGDTDGVIMVTFTAAQTAALPLAPLVTSVKVTPDDAEPELALPLTEVRVVPEVTR